MLKRAARVLARLRHIAPGAASAAQAGRRWTDELAGARTTPDQWIDRWRSEPRLYVDISEDHVGRLRQAKPELARATIDAASRVLRHEFNLLGSRPYTPADPDRSVRGDGYKPIDWYLDPVSGLRFPRGIPLAQWNLEKMRPGNADIKLPWELGRCQHWPVLGQAFRLTGDDRFAVEIANELGDFMEANPVGIGVNWTCTMDVALRAANWALALSLVRSCGTLTAGFWRAACEALFDHGVFIDAHLENTYEVTSNHFLSDVVGLFYVAAFFGDLPRGAAWDRQCRAWLEQEMRVQVLPDGADYESSVPYHRLVTELFLGSARLADHRGRPLPQPLLERLRGMVSFLEAMLRPDGLMPQIGDADDGRLHVLSGYGTWNPQDGRHVFGPAACQFRDAAWMDTAGEWGGWESAWWGFDEPIAGYGEWTPLDGIRHFPHAGVTAMRRRDDFLLITNGAVGTAGFGNHKHNDLLGFEYHVNGTPLIVDPGSYVYTSDPGARNMFRGTAFHNTVSVDGEEQNEVRPEWLFRMFEKAKPEHLAIIGRHDEFEYYGRHRGYARLPEPVIHGRTFRFSRDNGALTIVDVLQGRGTHRLAWHFHFAPGVKILNPEAGLIEMRANDTFTRMNVPIRLQPKISFVWYSPSYGVSVPCVALDLEVEERIDPDKAYVFEILP